MELHDIYPVEEIAEYSLYQFLLYLLLLILLIYVAVTYYKRRKNRPLSTLKILEISDHSRAKEMAFKLSYYGQSLNKTTEQEATFIKLKEKLTPFKYSHKDDVLTKELQDEIQKFLKALRQNNV